MHVLVLLGLLLQNQHGVLAAPKRQLLQLCPSGDASVAAMMRKRAAGRARCSGPSIGCPEFAATLRLCLCACVVFFVVFCCRVSPSRWGLVFVAIFALRMCCAACYLWPLKTVVVVVVIPPPPPDEGQRFRHGRRFGPVPANQDQGQSSGCRVMRGRVLNEPLVIPPSQVPRMRFYMWHARHTYFRLGAFQGRTSRCGTFHPRGRSFPVPPPLATWACLFHVECSRKTRTGVVCAVPSTLDGRLCSRRF